MSSTKRESHAAVAAAAVQQAYPSFPPTQPRSLDRPARFPALQRSERVLSRKMPNPHGAPSLFLPLAVRPSLGRWESGRKKCAKRRARRRFCTFFVCERQCHLLALPSALSHSSLSLSLPAQAQPKLPNLHCPSTMWDGLPTRSPFAVASSPTWPSRRPSGPWPGRGRRNRKRDTVADGRTDGRTDGRGRRRAASASTPNPLLRTTFTVHPSVHPSMRRLRRQQ